jgi:deazaflavin-dependent oxidoreductase (nitroreductase family)
MRGSAAKDRVIHPLQERLVNPVVKLAWALGIPPPGDALLETTGRRTGQPRRTPVCDGLDGQTFWLIAQRGRRADWIQNIEADPRVRIKTASWPRTRWRAGTAHVLEMTTRASGRRSSAAATSRAGSARAPPPR